MPITDEMVEEIHTQIVKGASLVLDTAIKRVDTATSLEDAQRKLRTLRALMTMQGIYTSKT